MREGTHSRDWSLPCFLGYIYPFHQKTERGIPVTITCTGREPPVYSMGTEHDSMGTGSMESGGS